jgi:ligand-binding SRPBCC domain-containing protein
MPKWQKARIEEATFKPVPPRPESALSQRFRGVAAGAGTTMTISFKPFPFSPFRVPWDAEITEFVWNDHFCDVQHRGPFAYWKHCHRLEPQIRGVLPGTLLVDHVEYELPFGPLGDLADRLFVKGQMESIFLYRQRLTAELIPRMPASA